MIFSLNEFLVAISFALDFVEMDVLGVTSNHGKRTAYICLKLAEELGLSFAEQHDIVALAILHDNGVSEKTLHDKLMEGNIINSSAIERVKEHCIIGEENIKQYPLMTGAKNIIKYHHEKYDGSGFFKLKKDEIPLMSQIIELADIIELNFDLQNNDYNTENRVIGFINQYENIYFSPKLAGAFRNVANNKAFWMELRGNYINYVLKRNMPQYNMDLSFQEIHRITGVFSKIIDSKSKFTQSHSLNLSEKAAIMADYYNIKDEEKMKLIIAADLHDIGKLAMPNSILESPDKLTKNEFEIIKEHTYYTRLALQEISGFEEITEWAANHHEKLNGEGYPYGKTEKDLDFNSRLIACLDIYEALTEERPYRKALNHSETMEILSSMKAKGFIDSKIVDDIDHVFKFRDKN